MTSVMSQRSTPASSPSLRPITLSIPSPCRSPLPAFPSPSTSPRSYARGPQQRPYALSPRSTTTVEKVVNGDTKAFAELVVDLIEKRARKARSGQLTPGNEQERKGRSLGSSLAGSWEMERAELIVDVPVWSPGSFQDLSTLHALRDTTLTHTHSLLAYLMGVHQIPASYRLLPRSAVNNHQRTDGRSSCRHQVGWGCIRLAPSVTSPVQHKRELKPAVRRTSAVYPRRPSVSKHMRKPSNGPTAEADIPHFKLDLDSAVVDEEDEDIPVKLREGYRTGGSSEDEDEEESADVLIAREVERRGTKEGEAFLMTLFGYPALIMC